MQTNEEIKKEFSVWCSLHSNSIGRLQEIDVSNIADFWLNKTNLQKQQIIEKGEGLKINDDSFSIQDPSFAYNEGYDTAITDYQNLIKGN